MLILVPHTHIYTLWHHERGEEIRPNPSRCPSRPSRRRLLRLGRRLASPDLLPPRVRPVPGRSSTAAWNL